jgi:hypothetical protein
MFINTFTGEALEKFNQAINDLQQNCMDAALLSSVDASSGITVDFMNTNSEEASGSYDPCGHSIKFRSINNIDQNTLRAELFHAYQNQFYKGKLAEIKNDVVNNHKGGSNVEFEEKAMGMAGGYAGGIMPGYNDSKDLYDLMYDLFDNNPNYNHVTFSDLNINNKWFNALETFRNNNVNATNMYGKPIDYDLLPTAFLDLINIFFNETKNNSDCIKGVNVIGIRVATQTN